MLLLCMVLIMSGIASAQPSFQPVRLDDGREATFYYPNLYDLDDGNVLTTWAVQSDSFVGTYGQSVTLTGGLAGEVAVYQELDFGDYLCPPHLTLVEMTGGGSVELILHN